MASIVSRIALAGIASLLAGCAVWSHRPAPKTAELPATDSLQRFAASMGASGSRLSPDGRKLLWQAASGTEVATFVRNVEGGEATVLRIGRKLPYWACDSRHLIVEDDPHGGDNTQVMLLDLDKPGAVPLNLTPWDGSKSQVIHAGDTGSGKLVLVSNRRDAAVFDVYTADPQNGKVEMVWKNSGDVARWIMDVDGSVGARVRRQDEHYILQVLNKSSNTWKSVAKWSERDSIQPIRIDRAADAVFVMSSFVRDGKTAGEDRDESQALGLPCRSGPAAGRI